MRFIHTSDWHINNSFSRFSSDKKEKLNDARWLAIEKLLEYAKKENIKLILVAGDQFDDGFNTKKESIERLFNLINKYNDIKFIMIAGNHDPFMDGSIYKKIPKENYPNNLKFVEDKEEILLDEYNCKIFATSLSNKNGTNNPLDWIDDKKGDCLRIGLVHGSIKIGNYNINDYPIDVGFAKEKNLDYLALGHYHTFYEKDKTLYCGTIEQMESHDTYYALDVELEKNKDPVIQKITGLNTYSWKKKELKIDDDNFNLKIEELKKDINEKTILELSIKGFLSFKNYNYFFEEIKNLNCFEVFIEESVKINPTEDEIINLKIDGYLKDIVDEIKKNNSIKIDRHNELRDFDINELNEKIINKTLLLIYDFFYDFFKEKGKK